MRKIIYALLFVVMGMSMSCSRKTYTHISNDMAKENISITQSDEEGAGQEPAWTYFERLSYVFGADSTCIGIRNDMDFPDWYSGCFVNDQNRLTINVIGDTVKLRHMLNALLQGNEFDIGVGLYSKRQQRTVDSLLTKAVDESNSAVARQLAWAWYEDGTIGLTVQGNNDSVIGQFKREVFDSPLLRFSIGEKVGVILEREEITVQEKISESVRAVDDFKTTETDNVTGNCGAFECHESSPQFPGGDVAMIDYIYSNLRYPKEAYDENIQGRVVVQFLVDKTGYIDSIKVVRSKGPYLDAEAVRIVKSFPKFIPGKFDFVPVNQWMTLPVKFNISDYEEKINKKYSAFQYDNGDDYVRDGLYRIVDERGRIGYADEKGNTIITPRFAFGFPFENGKAKVTDSGQEKEVEGSRGEYHCWESDDWYYIDKTGSRLDD